MKIGYFPGSYFAPTYFASTYFSTTAPPTPSGGVGLASGLREEKGEAGGYLVPVEFGQVGPGTYRPARLDEVREVEETVSFTEADDEEVFLVAGWL